MDIRRDNAVTPVIVFVRDDQETALACLLKLWHRTAPRHPLHVILPSEKTMTRLCAWAAERTPRVSVHRIGPHSGRQLADWTQGDSAVFLESSIGVLPRWLPEVQKTAKKIKTAAIIVPSLQSGVPHACVFLNAAALKKLAEISEPIRGVTDLISSLQGWLRGVKIIQAPAVAISGSPMIPCPHIPLPEVPKRQGIPRVLTVIHDAGGGAVQTTLDLCKALATAGTWHPILLRCGPFSWRLESFQADGQMEELCTLEFSSLWEAWREPDLARVTSFENVLTAVAPAVVHVRHLLGTGPWLLQSARRQGLPVVLSHHDYHAVCPTIELLDDTGKCCFGDCALHHVPPLNEGPDCVAARIWDLPPTGLRLRGEWLPEWRRTMESVFAECVDKHITTSKAASAILRANLRGLDNQNVKVIPHGRDFVHHKSIATSPATDRSVGVLSLGNLTRSKGREVLLEIARINKATGGPFVFHHLGAVEKSEELKAAGVQLHGSYERDSLAQAVPKTEFSFAIFPQIWPETFSHTLSEAWSLGLPVFASDVGAVGERVRESGGGWLFDPAQPEQWFARMSAIARDVQAWNSAASAIPRSPEFSIARMAEAYAGVYAGVQLRKIQKNL